MYRRVILACVCTLVALVVVAPNALTLDAGVFWSSRQIDISFSGSVLRVFGLAEPDNHVLIQVEGPTNDVSVFRQSKIAGMWTASKPEKFLGVPLYFAQATSSGFEPILEQVSAYQRTRYQLGIDYLKFSPERALNAISYVAYRRALVEIMEERKLFFSQPQPLQRIGSNLFFVNFTLPKNIYSGDYTVRVFFFEDKKLVDVREIITPLNKSWIMAKSVHFSNDNAMLYGLVMVVLSIVFGAGISTFLRRLMR